MKKLFFALLAISSFSFAQIADKPENISPLLIGEKIPSLELKNMEGNPIITTELFAKKSVIIVYRGGWCPYCTAHLSEIQKIESDILALGYQIIAISPDAPAFLKESVGKEKINYQLFSDSDGAFSQACGLAFATPEKYGKMLSKYSEGNNKGFLPVPTVFVVNEKSEITFEYINPDYSKRLNGNLLLAVLKNL